MKKKKKSVNAWGYVRDTDGCEHVRVAEKKMGRKLKANEIVHHKDGDKTNNNPSNLEVKDEHKHKSEHVIAQNKRRKRNSKGRFLN